MDLSALQQGVMTAVAAVAGITFSIAPAQPPREGFLTNPEVLSSFNIPEEKIETPPEAIQNLNSLTTPITNQIKLVVKEARASEEVTVKEPPLNFTVPLPTPKPTETPEPSKAPVKLELNVEEKESKPVASQSPKPEDKKEEDALEKPSVTSKISSPNAQILFDMTNNHRTQIGKPAFEKEERLCKIAQGRAPQVQGELSSGALHKGFKALNLPYWATENIAAYQTMEQNFNFLVTDYIHRKAIEGDAKYSCTACSGTACSQIFSSFVPK